MIFQTKSKNFGLTISGATTAIEIDPSYAKSYYRRAEANMVLEHYVAALADFKKVSLCLDRHAFFLNRIRSSNCARKTKEREISIMLV